MNITPLDINTRPLVMDYLRRFPVEVSELTFTNLFVWRHWKPIWIAETQNTLILLCDDHEGGKSVIGPPLGGNPDPFLLRAEIPGLSSYVRIPAGTAGFLEKAGLAVSPDANNSDYVYRTADLAELKGEKYHKKRNLVSQCLDKYNCKYLPLTTEYIPDCIGALDQWCFERMENLSPELCAEYKALREMFENYDRLQLRGGIILVNGCLQAFAVAEQLSPGTAVWHFEKAAPAVKGLGQVINQWFAANALNDFEYVNREQDLGLPGLRQAKQSYCPHHLVDKFTAVFP